MGRRRYQQPISTINYYQFADQRSSCCSVPGLTHGPSSNSPENIFSGSKCKWTESTTVNPSRTLLWLYRRLQCNWICCKSTFLNLYRGWGHNGLGQYTHEIFFISSDVRAASTNPAGSAAPGRTGRILMPLMVLCNQEPLAVYYSNHTANYVMLSNIYRSLAQVRRSRMWNVNVPIQNPAWCFLLSGICSISLRFLIK